MVCASTCGGTVTESPTDRFARASSEMGRLEARLAELRTERADAIDEMRTAGLSWSQIEEVTGLTRQRLWQLGKAQNSSAGSESTSSVARVAK